VKGVGGNGKPLLNTLNFPPLAPAMLEWKA